MIKAPAFWNNKGPVSAALVPLSWIWRAAGSIRDICAKSQRADMPVICVGNLSVGGTGKTPIVALLADALQAAGHTPAILSRGYGGSVAGPLWVDPTQHDAGVCGDEPLMLAETRDVLIARDRIAGARAIAQRGIHDVIIMDDGLQNPFIEKDMKIGVFDGAIGIGNGRVVPAGPLRVSFRDGLKELDMAIINGEDETDLAAQFPDDMPWFTGMLTPDQTMASDFADTPLLAFAGIGRPQRFFNTLKTSGATLAHQLAFADHHPYSEADLTKLQEDAVRLGARLITTQKDWIRLPAEWREKIAFLPVSMTVQNEPAVIKNVRDQIRSASVRMV